jgi:hypothetical protein
MKSSLDEGRSFNAGPDGDVLMNARKDNPLFLIALFFHNNFK